MSLASPERLMWLALAVPIIAFYLLRTRRRRVPVSTVLFWDQLFEPKRQRAWWQRLRHWFSLLLQLLFLGLVVAALVDPLWTGQQRSARQVVLVLDNSASMAASGDEGQTRFQLAQQQALEIVGSLREGDQVALVTAGSSVRVPLGMTDFTPAARDAISAVELTHGPGRLAAAIEAARRLTRFPDQRRIVVLSDSCLDEAPQLAEPTDVDWVTVGQAADNVAITAFAVRRSLVDPIGYVGRVELENFGQAAVELRMTVDLADSLVDVIPVRLEPGQPWNHTISGASATGGPLRVRLDIEDALAIDNQALAMLPPRPAIPVTLVTDEPNLYLQSVFSSLPLVDLTVTDQSPAAAPPGGFLVLHRIVPEPLPGGAVLVVDPTDDSDAWTLGPPLDQAIVAGQADDSALLPHVLLMNVMLPGARALTMVEGAQTLLSEAGGGTVMASLVRGDDRLLVLTAELDSSDLPLRIAFPVLMTNAVNWFLRQTGDLQPSLRTGELAQVPLAATANPAAQPITNTPPVAGVSPTATVAPDGEPRDWAWVDPDGRLIPTAVSGDRAIVGPVDRVGWVRLGPRRLLAETTEDSTGATAGAAAAGAATNQPGVQADPGVQEEPGVQAEPGELLTIAVNLCDRQESDLRPRGQPLAQASETLQLGGLGRRPPWFYLAIAALGLIAAEWFFYQRRWVG